jgi:AraC-like DNA-binding protein
VTYYANTVARLTRQCLPNPQVVQQVIRAKKLIDLQYCDNVPISTLAASAHLSKFHFIRLFKQCYGVTPHQYITACRVQHAKALLKQNHSVSSACFAAGFTSETSFAALLKRHTGKSPSAWRKMSNFQ